MVQLTQKIKLLAMDFDGVIADSILECAVVGYNGYEIYCNRKQKVNTPEEIKSDKLNKFQLMRPYIRSGEDYIYLFQAIDDDIFVSNQEEFDNFRNDHLDRRDSYYQIFYSTRQMMMKSDYKLKAGRRTLVPGYFDGTHFEVCNHFAPGMVSPLAHSNAYIMISEECGFLEAGTKVKIIPINFSFTSREMKSLVSG